MSSSPRPRNQASLVTMIIGGLLAIAPVFGPRSILFLLIIMGAGAFVAGLTGYQLSSRGFVSIPAPLAVAIAAHQHDYFMAVWFAHCTSYLIGLTGGALLCFRIWRRRGRPAIIPLYPRTRAAAIRARCIAALVIFIVWSRFHTSL